MKTLNEIGHTEPTETEQIGQFIDKHQPRQLLILAISEDGRSHVMERGFGFANNKEAIFEVVKRFLVGTPPGERKAIGCGR